MLNNNKLDDIKRMRKIEKELKNQKKPWFLREYLGRNLMQWLNLYIGLFVIIMTLRHPIFSIIDLFMMVFVGINISLWLFGGLMNVQRKLIEEVLEQNRKLITLAAEAVNRVESLIGNRNSSCDYYDIQA